jgi:hypothetical protein
VELLGEFAGDNPSLGLKRDPVADFVTWSFFFRVFWLMIGKAVGHQAGQGRHHIQPTHDLKIRKASNQYKV